jgi:hypothetical protein
MISDSSLSSTQSSPKNSRRLVMLAHWIADGAGFLMPLTRYFLLFFLLLSLMTRRLLVTPNVPGTMLARIVA